MSNFGLRIGIEGERDFKAALREINQSLKVLGSEMQLSVILEKRTACAYINKKQCNRNIFHVSSTFSEKTLANSCKLWYN